MAQMLTNEGEPISTNGISGSQHAERDKPESLVSPYSSSIVLRVFQPAMLDVPLRKPDDSVSRFIQVVQLCRRQRHLFTASYTCRRDRLHGVVIPDLEFGSDHHACSDIQPRAVLWTFAFLPSNVTS